MNTYSKTQTKTAQGSSSQLDRVAHERDELVKKLLNEINVKETRDKYAKQSIVEISTDHLGPKFQNDLRRLMGSDVIRFNDREWDEQFHKAIQQEVEKLESKKEERLARAERERILRLEKQGIDPMVNKKRNRKKKVAIKDNDVKTHKEKRFVGTSSLMNSLLKKKSVPSGAESTA
ncbi:uncharacterized protein LOC121384169 [Gigantopelta aegis]|uniref:uncharacterized protein LOC121384169 n=1 Tax=Gigantopelta aegis TaxID=1735272 RepID=UPI001B88A9E5|nr:uncharacterized protein LOC121384169 [Gigantopelta aegis]